MENLDVAVLRTLRDGRTAGRRGPVRLHIGSKTPPEIAISVMAEIQAVKNGKDITA